MIASHANGDIKWPDVPACYGWLSLDRRGAWRLKGEVIRHSGLIAFINRNYGAEANGCWVFRNGPQRVYVALEYAPLVMRLQADNSILLHTGIEAGNATGIWIDEDGSVLLRTGAGIGLLDDRDLMRLLDEAIGSSGRPADESELDGAMAGTGHVSWRGLPVRGIRRETVAERFGFVGSPRA